MISAADRERPSASLREQKREQTRRDLVNAAVRLIGQRGYTRTTIADIAAAARVAPRTVFAYFPTKEDLLFPEAESRIQAAVAAFDERRDDETPTDVLLRALDRVNGATSDLIDDTAALRLELIRTEPAVRGRALLLLSDAQEAIARALHRAYPERFTATQAGAVVGAFIGAAAGAASASMSSDESERPSAVSAAVRDAMRAWTAELPRD